METLTGFLLPVLLGIGLALLATSPILLPIILRWLADREIFFARGNEGEYRAVTRNTAFRKGVVIYKGFKENKGDIVNEKGEVIVKDGNIVTRDERDSVLKPLHAWWRKKCGGIFPLWIPKVDEVYRYNFRWIKLFKVKPKGTEDGYLNETLLPNGQYAVSFEKVLDYIYLRDANYFFLLKNAETMDVDKKVSINVSIYAVVTLRIMNPYMALFRVDNWLDVTLIAIESALRSWAARSTYLEILRKKEVLEHQIDDEFLRALTERGEQLVDYVLSRYGAQVKRIQFIEVELPERINTQINEAEAAKKEAEQIITLADARAAEITKTFDPILARGEAGLAIFALEKVEKAAQGPGNTVVTVGPGLVKELIGLASGVKVPKGGKK